MLFWILKPHIKSLVAEKLAVEQKYPDRKSVNMANNYTENEYNSYILMIRSPQLKCERSLFLSKVEDIWINYKVYRTIYVSPNI